MLIPTFRGQNQHRNRACRCSSDSVRSVKIRNPSFSKLLFLSPNKPSVSIAVYTIGESVTSPPPASYQKFVSLVFNDDGAEEEDSAPSSTTSTTTRPSTTTTVHDELAAHSDDSEPTTKRPRVVGPPLRKPRPPPPSGGSGSGERGTGVAGGVKKPLTLGSGSGKCPPGNEPTKDEYTGKLVLCTGSNPNCPPRSYCYVTTGGYATEQYNCCKSW